jgi:hypothetical protein
MQNQVETAPPYLESFLQEMMNMLTNDDGTIKDANSFTEDEIGKLFNYIYNNLNKSYNSGVTDYEDQKKVADGANLLESAAEISEA